MQTLTATALPAFTPAPAAKPNLFTRGDTLFGVCQGLGEDLGFNPNWLRVAFAVSLLTSPTLVIGTYVALGLVVFVSRVIAPDRRWALPKIALPKLSSLRLRRRKAAVAVAEAVETAPTGQFVEIDGDNDSIAETLAAAA